MKGSAPKIFLTGSQVRPITKLKPNLEIDGSARSSTFQTIAPRRTTAPRDAASVIPLRETSPTRSPRRRREARSEWGDGTALTETGTLNRHPGRQDARHQAVTTPSPCVCPPPFHARAFWPRSIQKQREKGGERFGQEDHHAFRSARRGRRARAGKSRRLRTGEAERR